MKIAITSDLHLEFDKRTLPAVECDVLVLAGDILNSQHIHENPRRYDHFVGQLEQFPNVIAVAGNHEFFGGKIHKGLDYLKDYYAEHNVTFLEDSTVTIEGQRFVGCTLWTDCNGYDPLTMYHLRDMMNNYKKIHDERRDYAKLRPRDTVAIHHKSRKYLELVTTPDDIVITHHAPSPRSIPPQFANDYIMNGGYASNVPLKAKLYIHGHMHDPVDYTQEESRVFSNPHGYYGEMVKLRVLEV